MRKTRVIACFALLLAITATRAGPVLEATNGTAVGSACGSGGARATHNASEAPGFDSIVGVIQNNTGNATAAGWRCGRNASQSASATAADWRCGRNASLAGNQSGSATAHDKTRCLNDTAPSGRNGTRATEYNTTLRNDTIGEHMLKDEDVPKINETVDGDRSACPPLVGLEAWGGRAPLSVERVRAPVAFVVVHHTYIPAACNSSDDCEAKMRQMQDFHMGKGWLNIGYNFIVGGDNRVYVGRGWDVVGAHSPVYNFKSVGISFIGDYRTELPTQQMLELASSLIRCGVARGSISESYKLVGHRQVRNTECPGDRLYQEIQAWPHWAAHRDIIPRTSANTTSRDIITRASANATSLDIIPTASANATSLDIIPTASANATSLDIIPKASANTTRA